jgi:hypothetical protein
MVANIITTLAKIIKPSLLALGIKPEKMKATAARVKGILNMNTSIFIFLKIRQMKGMTTLKTTKLIIGIRIKGLNLIPIERIVIPEAKY